MARDRLYSYSLIRTLHDSGDDYIDSFWPLIVDVAPADGQPTDLPTLKTDVGEKFGVTIPDASLRTILRRATRKGLMQLKDRLYSLTPQGIELAATQEPLRDVQRRVNELADAARLWVNENTNLQLGPDETLTAIEHFVRNNIEYVLDLTCNSNSHGQQNYLFRQNLLQKERALAQYFAYVEANVPQLYETLRQIIYGSIIAIAVETDCLTQTTEHFSHTRVYFDTNYLFSLLDLHEEDANRAACELFDLMKKSGAFTFAVFDFTLQEAISVLRRFATESRKYSAAVRVNSIYSSMKRSGWTPARVNEFVADIIQHLDELDISIEPTGVRLGEYETEDPARRGRLGQYKPYQTRRTQDHDLAAVEWVRETRSSIPRRIEHARHLFLSADSRLVRFSIREWHHGENGTISEVVSDHVLTNILWLKSPQSLDTLPVSTVIALHSRGLIVDQRIWRKFYDTVMLLEREDRLDDLDISVLLYSGHVEDVLSALSIDDIEDVDQTMVFQTVEEARSLVGQEMDQRTTKEIEKVRTEFLAEMAQAKEALTREASAAIAEKDTAVDTAVDRALTSIQDRSRATARRVAALSCALLVVSVFTLVYWFCQWLEPNWDWLEPWTFGVGIALILTWTIVGKPNIRVYSFLQRWLSNRLYRRAFEAPAMQSLLSLRSTSSDDVDSGQAERRDPQ